MVLGVAGGDTNAGVFPLPRRQAQGSVEMTELMGGLCRCNKANAGVSPLRFATVEMTAFLGGTAEMTAFVGLRPR